MEHPDVVSRETEEKLRHYQDLLLSWNRRINLISSRDEAVLWQRHILDSVQVAPLLPRQGAVADLGSGAGLPGLIIAIMRPEPIHLVEADKRKAAFLLEATRALGLRHVTVHAKRVEATSLPPLAGITARALAPLADLLPHAHRFLLAEGVAVFPKGRAVEAELTDAASHWLMRVERFPSLTDPEATLLRLSEIRPAGA